VTINSSGVAVLNREAVNELAQTGHSASIRPFLLKEAQNFIRRASKMEGVRRIALIGSLTTGKPKPKDLDLLITIEATVNMAELAAIGRKAKGRLQSQNSGADIFLCNEAGEYLGRTCSYRECHPRRLCRGMQCRPGSYLCDDLEVVTLSPDVIRDPPCILWPGITYREPLPRDVMEFLDTCETVVGWAE